MDLQCPQCRTLILLGDQTLTGNEALCCTHCHREIRVRLSAAPPDEKRPKDPPLRLKVAPRDMAALTTETGTAQGARPPRGTGAWTLANLGLILLLVFQYAYFLRDDLARYPALRPWLERLCAVAGCKIPLQRDLRRIKVVARDLRPHPDVTGALRITITILNEAPFPQPYPTLDLRFYDLDQRLVAGRRFPPAVYLPPGTDLERGLAPDTPLPIVLELVDPGRKAVNFQFEFL